MRDTGGSAMSSDRSIERLRQALSLDKFSTFLSSTTVWALDADVERVRSAVADLGVCVELLSSAPFLVRDERMRSEQQSDSSTPCI
jgi:hypothetical protein